MTSGHLVDLQRPRADVQRRCPYHGGRVRLADCPVVASDSSRRGASGAAGGRPEREETSRARGLGVLGDDGPRDDPRRDGAGREVRRMEAVTYDAGTWIRSAVDDAERFVLAAAPGHRRRWWKRVEPLHAPAQLVVRPGDARRGPVRACPICRHPLPESIDHHNPRSVALVGHSQSSKTATVVALVEEIRLRGSAAFGVRRLATTEAAYKYLYGISWPDQPREENIFTLYRERRPLPLTQRERHPPLEFKSTLGDSDVELSLLLHDVSGESLMDRFDRSRDAPYLGWADAIVFVYNPRDSPRLDDRGQRDQAALLQGIRGDLARRGPHDASGAAHRDPPLFLVVSQADLVAEELGCDIERYSERDVRDAIGALGDGAVVAAAQGFADVHWRFLAPMPGNSDAKGVAELFRAVLSTLG